MTPGTIGRRGRVRAVTARLALVAVVPLVGSVASPAAAQDTGWTVRQFDVTYTVRADRVLLVEERIEVDFGALRRHGIIRDIPVRYRRVVAPGSVVQIPAGRVETDLDLIAVTDETGDERQTKISGGSTVHIRIGDPDGTVSGRQTYIIRYTLTRALGFFEDHDELYWQVTGTGWPVPIEAATAIVSLPEVVSRTHAGGAPWSAECYAGDPSSTSGVGCSAAFVDAGRFSFATTRVLAPGEGLTLVAVFPKDVIEPPGALASALDMLRDYGPLGIPVLTLALLIGWWRRHGREPRIGSVVPQWEPPEGLRPGTAAALVDQKADMDDVIATILDLAVRGHLRIEETKPIAAVAGIDPDSLTGRLLGAIGFNRIDWEIVRLEGPDNLLPFERALIDGLFDDEAQSDLAALKDDPSLQPAHREIARALAGDEGRVRVSQLQKRFYKHLPEVRNGLYARLVEQGFFPRSPESTRSRWWGAGVAVVTLSGVGVFFGHVILAGSFILSGLLVIIFARAMPAMTAEGARQARHVRGLEEYIRRAEKDEIDRLQGPEVTLDLFNRLLPYAVALDVSDVWVGLFENALAEAPTWYAGSSGTWSSHRFSRGLSDFRTAATRTMSSAPGSGSGSGGGGSVGGGGGGGGGGSW